VANEHIRKFAKVVEIKLAWEVVPEEA